MTTRLDRALTVRDVVLAWLRENGHDEVMSGIRVRDGEASPFSFIHRTPFSRIPQPLPRDYDGAVLLQRGPANLPYALDVWRSSRKVMLLEWDHDGSPDLVSFATGDWDGQLLSRLAPV